MPFFVIFLILAPSIAVNLVFVIFSIGLHLFSLSDSVNGGIILSGIMVLSPHGALFSALLATTQNFADYIQNYPPVGATIATMVIF